MKPIRLSILDLSPIFPDATPQEALRQSVLLAQTGERLGYTRYWAAEHHDMPHLASSYPEVLLAHIGAQTKRIRIGSGAVLLPYYKPYKVAEAFSLLATLHPNRVDLGIGRAPGGSAHVSLALSDNYLEQVRRMPELVQDLSTLLANEYVVEGHPVKARPIPPVPPELWLLGTNMKSAQYAAQFGTGYVFGHFMSEKDGNDILTAYRSEFQPSRLNQRPKVILAVGVTCGETEEEARRLAEDSLELVSPSDNKLEKGISDNGRYIIGNPEQVKNALEELQERCSVDEFMIVTSIPDYVRRIRSYELLAETIFPS